MNSAYKYDVFLSHNSKDKEIVISIARKLRDVGLSVWLDTWNLIPGKRWQEALEQGIKDSAVLAVFIGEGGFGKWENEEIRVAIDAQVSNPNPERGIIPVLLPKGEVSDVTKQLFLARHGWVNFQNGIDDENEFRRFIAGIKSEEPGDLENLPFSPVSPLFIERSQVDKDIPDRDFKRDIQLKFVNHHELIEKITLEKASPYHLIDSPAGFGKTMIMKELKEHFQSKDKDWLISYVGIQGKQSLQQIGALIAQEFDISVDDFSPVSLAKAVYQEKGDTFTKENKRGIVLFFDVEKEWSSAVGTIRSLMETFIPELSLAFKTLSFQDGVHSYFRVIIASRYINRELPHFPRLNFRLHKLSPLKFIDVQEAVEDFLNIHDDLKLKQITAHLMYYTAGHPGCVARVLGLYDQDSASSPEHFFRDNEKQIHDVVYPEIDDIRLGISEDLRRVFDELSAFRFLDTDILKKYVEEKDYLESYDEFSLSDRLRNTYLMDDKWSGGYFLRDGITRRLIPLRLIKGEGVFFISHLCKKAQKICSENLEKIETQMPDKWLIEYYFQYLQQFLGKIQNKAERKRIHDEFFSTVIDKGFQAFSNVRDPRRYRSAVLDTIRNDDEFAFMVNYYLRDDEYENMGISPYEKFETYLTSLFQQSRLVSDVQEVK